MSRINLVAFFIKMFEQFSQPKPPAFLFPSRQFGENHNRKSDDISSRLVSKTQANHSYLAEFQSFKP